MKNYIVLLITLFFFSANILAQQVPQSSISSVKQKNKTVEFTVTAAQPFYMGNNVYVLHISKKDFHLSRQSVDNGKGVLTFFIPLRDYNRIKQGTNIYLTYGYILTGKEQEMQEVNEQNPAKYQLLGKFSKQLLTK